MKAIRLHGRGGPEQLVCEDSPAPALEAGEVLIRVHACSVTRAELTWPPVHTAHDGSTRPFIIPGHEVSGVVEAVGGETLERSGRVLRRGGVLVAIASSEEVNPQDKRAAVFGVPREEGGLRLGEAGGREHHPRDPTPGAARPAHRDQVRRKGVARRS